MTLWSHNVLSVHVHHYKGHIISSCMFCFFEFFIRFSQIPLMEGQFGPIPTSRHKLLGRGGNGEVYSVMWRGEEYAVKQVGPWRRQCSTYEAKRTLSHCMCYYNLGDVDGVPVQGIELLEGFQPSSFDEPAGCRDRTTRWRSF